MNIRKKIKEASGNEFSELSELIGRIEDDIKVFSHVEQFLPPSFINELRKLSDKVSREYEHRQNNF